MRNRSQTLPTPPDFHSKFYLNKTIKDVLLLFLLAFIPGQVLAQKDGVIQLKWQEVQIQEDGKSRIHFEGSHFLLEYTTLPYYHIKFNTSLLNINKMCIRDSIGRSPYSKRITLLLPLPVLPIRYTNSPRCTSRFTSFSTRFLF